MCYKRACLIATVDSNTTNQSTLKLVAANLIAENKIDEGSRSFEINILEVQYIKDDLII